MSQATELDRQIREGLLLIKRHIGPEETIMNIELHQAVQKIVDACRVAGLLLDEEVQP